MRKFRCGTAWLFVIFLCFTFFSLPELSHALPLGIRIDSCKAATKLDDMLVSVSALARELVLNQSEGRLKLKSRVQSAEKKTFDQNEDLIHDYSVMFCRLGYDPDLLNLSGLIDPADPSGWVLGTPAYSSITWRSNARICVRNRIKRYESAKESSIESALLQLKMILKSAETEPSRTGKVDSADRVLKRDVDVSDKPDSAHAKIGALIRQYSGLLASIEEDSEMSQLRSTAASLQKSISALRSDPSLDSLAIGCNREVMAALSKLHNPRSDADLPSTPVDVKSNLAEPATFEPKDPAAAMSSTAKGAE